MHMAVWTQRDRGMTEVWTQYTATFRTEMHAEIEVQAWPAVKQLRTQQLATSASSQVLPFAPSSTCALHSPLPPSCTWTHLARFVIRSFLLNARASCTHLVRPAVVVLLGVDVEDGAVATQLPEAGVPCSAVTIDQDLILVPQHLLQGDLGPAGGSTESVEEWVGGRRVASGVSTGWGTWARGGQARGRRQKMEKTGTATAFRLSSISEGCDVWLEG